MLKRHICLTAILAVVATGCGGGNGGSAGDGRFSGTDLAFSISLAEEETAAVREVLDQFQQRTGASVKLTSVASADLPPKLRVEVGAGKPTIHLFAQDNLALRPLVDENLVEDLSDVELPQGIEKSMIPEKFNEKQYFLPFRPNVRVAYVNRERFRQADAEAPSTVEELRSTAEKLKEEAGSPKMTLSLAEGDPASVTISEWIVSFGGDPLILNDEGSVRAFEFLQGMWRDQLLARESLLAKFDTEVDYLQGETAWLAQNWPITSAQLAEQDLLNKFHVYEGWKGPERAAHVIGGDVLGIPRGVSGRQKQAAVELATYLMSSSVQETFVERNAWPSIRADAYGNVPEEQKATFQAIQKALEDGWFRPNVSFWSDVSEQMNAAVRRVVVGGEPVKAVLDELHSNIESAAKQKNADYPPPPNTASGGSA